MKGGSDAEFGSYAQKGKDMATNENELGQQDEAFELSDELLKEVAGGGIVNDKTKVTLNGYIKRTKSRGLTLSEALVEVHNIYGSNERFCNAFIDYICANW